jgi:hypothetical protein
LWEALGHSCTLFSGEECWNFFKAAGYTCDQKRDGLGRDGPTQTELDDAKAYVTGALPLAFDSNARIARNLVGFGRTIWRWIISSGAMLSSKR